MTIRLRLTFWYTALLGTTLILFSVVVYSALANNLRVQVEQDAARQANEVATALAQQLQLDVLIVRNSPTRVQIPELDFLCQRIGRAACRPRWHDPQAQQYLGRNSRSGVPHGA